MYINSPKARRSMELLVYVEYTRGALCLPLSSNATKQPTNHPVSQLAATMCSLQHCRPNEHTSLDLLRVSKSDLPKASVCECTIIDFLAAAHTTTTSLASVYVTETLSPPHCQRYGSDDSAVLCVSVCHIIPHAPSATVERARARHYVPL